MRISVVVPTYKRVNDLRRCLTALDKQISLPYEIIVVVRYGDHETLSYIRGWVAEKSLYRRKFRTVKVPGQVQALVKGLEVASAEVVAFTDDDATPSSCWLLKMRSHYQNPKVGGVGGRDILINHPTAPTTDKVGKITLYGKIIGNHHLGHGEAREVDVLKGVNMSLRTNLVEFSSLLRGPGAQTHNEVGLCLRVKRLGYSLIYDPSITVDHHVAPRIDSEQRTQFNMKSVANSAFNLQISLLTWLPWYQKLLRLIYSTFIGDKSYPGIARFVVAVVRWEVRVLNSYLPSQIGFLIAILQYSRFGYRLARETSRNSSDDVVRHKSTPGGF